MLNWKSGSVRVHVLLRNISHAVAPKSLLLSRKIASILPLDWSISPDIEQTGGYVLDEDAQKRTGEKWKSFSQKPLRHWELKYLSSTYISKMWKWKTLHRLVCLWNGLWTTKEKIVISTVVMPLQTMPQQYFSALVTGYLHLFSP